MTMTKEELSKFYSFYLPSLKIKGNQGQALCPFHSDTHPSLSINLKTGEFNCFGCGKKGSVFDFYMAKYGVGFKEAKEALAKQAGVLSEPQKKIVKTYDYTDEFGMLLFQVCRYEPKDFRFRRPDGKGGWIWNLEGVDRVLYNFPFVIPSQEVFVVEGEKDAETLKTLGFVATCCPGGAGKWRDEYNSHLKAKDVAIVPDNDSAGKKHALEVAKSVKKVAKNVKILELSGLPEKGDISDWIGEGGTKEKLLELIKVTSEWQPPEKQALIERLLKWNDIADLDVKAEYLLDSLIPKGAITLLFGRGGIGKTWLALQISRAIAEGLPFGNLQTIKTPVYYIDFENPMAILKERFEKIGKAQNLYIWHISNQLPPPRLDDIRWIEYQELLPGLVVFDTLRASHLSDENDSRPMALIMQRLKELREKGFTLLLLHHTPKSNENIFKGSTVLLDLADHILGFEGVKDSEAIEFDTKNLYQFGTRIKTRYKPSQVFLSFDPEKGFEIAKDPDIEKMEAISEILKSFNSPPNQKELKKKISEELDYSEKEGRRLLKKGEGIFWEVEKGHQRSLVYSFKSVCQNVPIIYSGHIDTFNNLSDTPKNKNTSQPLDNTELVNMSEGSRQTDTLPDFEACYQESKRW